MLGLTGSVVQRGRKDASYTGWRPNPQAFRDPDAADRFRKCLRSLPLVPWGDDVDAHAKKATDQLLTAAKDCFSGVVKDRQRAWISDSTWALVTERLKVRRLLVRIRSLGQPIWAERRLRMTLGHVIA